MIEKLIFSSRTTEVDSVSINIIGAYKKSDWSADTHLSAIFTSLEAEGARLTAAIKRSKVESELEEKDELRDAGLRSLHYLLTGLMHHPDPAIQTAAGEVDAVFDNYGLSIQDENYASQSSLTSSLLLDLDRPELQASIDLLSGCSEIIEGIRAAENDFIQASIAYKKASARESTLESATQIKAAVVNVINNRLVIYLRAMVQVDESTYGDLGRTIARIIGDNNEVVKKRRKKP